MAKMTRRTFLGSSAMAVIVAGMRAQGKVFGANGRVRMGVIGLHGRGGGHMRDCLERQEGVELAAICDPDRQVMEERLAQAKQMSGKTPKTYVDMRELFADATVDAVSVCTPNHWHALAAIWACESGKDVYVEKPLSHNVREGRVLAEVAERTGRIVFHGTQQRSNARVKRDIGLLREGIIGDVVHARGFVYKTTKRQSIGFAPNAEAPGHLDWDIWQGPAQGREYCANYVHYNWHWFWEYGNGEIGNQGVHEMDVAVWGIGKGAPVRVYSTGGRYGWEDQGETPNTQTTCFTYADGTVLTFEVRNLGSYGDGGFGGVGNSLFGTKGYYVRDKGFFDYQNQPIAVDEIEEAEDHRGAFIKAVLSRKPEDVPVTPLEGHISCLHCHLGNIAYRLKRSLEFDPETERFRGDEEANALLTRPYREPFVAAGLA